MPYKCDSGARYGQSGNLLKIVVIASEEGELSTNIGNTYCRQVSGSFGFLSDTGINVAVMCIFLFELSMTNLKQPASQANR